MFYAGEGKGGPVFLPKESHFLVLGPPRSGKTRSIVIPNILASPGPVIATSTKSDLIEATFSARSKEGRVMVFDPSNRVAVPRGIVRVHWSPINPRGDFSDALVVTRAMVESSILIGGRTQGYSHWIERASSLLAPLIHAAQVGGYEMDSLMSWLNRRELKDPAGILKASGETLALDTLMGVLMCEERERSGIFSTALGLLASYNYPELHEQANFARFDAKEFLDANDTLFVVSPSHIQSLVAPVIVGLIDEVKSRSFLLSSNVSGDVQRKPLALILDEMANVAPLGSITSILSEGASQKVMLLGAIQDLSQARTRWGESSRGFLTLFGSTLVLGGISDTESLRQLSEISGKLQDQSVSKSYGRQMFSRMLGPSATTISNTAKPALEPWEIARAISGQGFLFRRSRSISKVNLVAQREFAPLSREMMQTESI